MERAGLGFFSVTLGDFSVAHHSSLRWSGRINSTDVLQRSIHCKL